ncbi:hypothetical protein BDR05DRAFT_288113 [Suillus weaverae]|nr:hypothetical protein BDR05DRAFT_288113 [Suillus weaverae]
MAREDKLDGHHHAALPSSSGSKSDNNEGEHPQNSALPSEGNKERRTFADNTGAWIMMDTWKFHGKDLWVVMFPFSAEGSILFYLLQIIVHWGHRPCVRYLGSYLTFRDA